ncbi:putative lipid II flippase FtsW [bacterium]|nr:MAG: putative lipid II flippase FtsW [bacterium]
MHKYDKNLFWAIVIVVLIGTVMVYSASSTTSARKFGDPLFFLKRQIIRVIIGFGALYLGIKIDYHFWQKYAFWGIIAIGGLLFLPLIPQVAGIESIKGAQRWVKIFGSSTLQPAELAKFALVIFLAEECSKRQQILSDLKSGILPIIIPPAILITAILLQPNFGMVMGLLMVTASMLLVAGIPIKLFTYLGTPVAVSLSLLMISSEHAFLRLKSFFMDSDPLGDGYQAMQSMIALGSGGLLGLGLGQGKQKIFYLPESHTDFIFAVIGEELGLVGTMIVVLLFAYIAWRGIRIVFRAPDRFGAYLAFGITATFVFFALINLGVVTRLIPTTGIPLPFISYGGSQLVVHMFMAGVLLNISSVVKSPVNRQKLELVGEK